MRSANSLLFVLLLIAASADLRGQTLQQHYSRAMEAYRTKNYELFYSEISAAHSLNTTHQGILYQLGLAEARTGRLAEAVRHLRAAILINADFKLSGIEDVKVLEGRKDYQDLLQLQQQWQQPVVNATTAVTIKDRQLHAEGLAYDAVRKQFYVGSIHKRKVITIRQDGTQADFCTSGVDGMTSVFGLKLDERRGLLWVCSSPMEEMEAYDSAARSAIYALDLKTAQVRRKISPPQGAPAGIFGDILLSKKGEVFVTDGRNNTILEVVEGKDAAQVYFSSAEFVNLQGLALSDDERYLFIADYVKGLFRLDRRSMTLEPLGVSKEVSLKGIDGLYYYHNSLIAIQNGVSPLRVTRYRLNKTSDTITDFEILDRKHPAFNEPTLGVLHGNDFYYIANSQWSGYTPAHQLKPDNQLQDIIILHTVLKP